ncbi:glycoside hydrolase family 88 protein [Cyclobacterium qasimii]|uniref:Glucuronyl hydrolase n=3 Tax=Cyclobacterium qasimii TaxID=1350429 RepID=S7VMF3_9BACT|nr:glycoside hydrolase family 88 protein [Cyclobacterium qasimii]EPR71126.1 Glucuronyl hydrolase [Cyclobacterium qasimii M12-11B]GEO22765.1 glucuronyl hydrolase [Cyclobacterium qasimii]
MCKNPEKEQHFTIKDLDVNIDFAVKQSILMGDLLADSTNIFPRTADENGNLLTIGGYWWTTGFFPGSLWLLYAETKDENLKTLADKLSSELAPLQFSTDNHDIGWIINSSFGNSYRINENRHDADVILQTAKSLITRYSSTVGSIRSWDKSDRSEKNGWDFIVNIDNMMNLELLTTAYRISSDAVFLQIAIEHADKTLKNHFRSDNSSYHVVDYDTLTGEARKKQTVQGYADDSSWARGQAWGLYGFTMMYRETGKQRYLDQAKLIAEFIVNHPRLPNDKIPYWDFDAPDIPNANKDASAAAIICSALIELSQYVDNRLSAKYMSVAKQQLKSLSSPAYQAKLGENACFILKHSVGAFPANSEVDVPLIYADYYYVEAMIRLKNIYLRNLK